MKKLTTLLGSMLAVTFLGAAIADDHSLYGRLRKLP